jgi:hypothetical protein
MLRDQGLHCFQLQQHLILDNDISVKFTNVSPPIDHCHGNLRFGTQTGIGQCYQQRFFIDGFKKAAAKFITDLKAGVQNLLRQLLMYHRAVLKIIQVCRLGLIPFIPFIPVNCLYAADPSLLLATRRFLTRVTFCGGKRSGLTF